MASADKVEIRPRTTGEILDDAWRLYLSNVPLLLALSGLFTVPLATTLLLLLTLPRPENLVLQFVLPVLTALALPITGLASGACQAAFLRLAEGEAAGLKSCWGAALRQGLDHAAARALLVLVTSPALLLVVAPAVVLWVIGLGVHPVLARGEGRLLQALGTSAREIQRQPVKSLVVFLVRPVLLLFAVFNLHMFLWGGLWVAENLAGLDVAFLRVSLSLFNPVYDAGLVLAAWILLVPYAEAVNYLLHIDAEARFQGLDLEYRVQRLFPSIHRAQTGMILAAVALGLTWTGAARAVDHRAEVQKARKDLAGIQREVAAANPYPGGARWSRRLSRIAEELDPGGTVKQGRYRWFRQGIQGFARLPKEEALNTLTELDRKLALVEASLPPAESPQQAGSSPPLTTDDIKKLLPPGSEEANKNPGAAPKPSPQEKKKDTERVARDDPEEEHPRGGPARSSSGGIVAPQARGGFTQLGYLVLAGMLAAILVTGVILFVQGKKKTRPAHKPAKVEKPDLSLESVLTEPEQHSFAALWQQAEELARKGNLLVAVRTLYLAVLALLHRANLIRYERTRTNGEYVQQLHERPEVQREFRRLTRLFEMKWYGQRSCQPADYNACREMVEKIRDEVQ